MNLSGIHYLLHTLNLHIIIWIWCYIVDMVLYKTIQNKNSLAENCETFTVIRDEVVMAELPTKTYSKHTNASSCCEFLNQITSLKYLVNDVDVFEHS